jgi:hypothetical protein
MNLEGESWLIMVGRREWAPLGGDVSVGENGGETVPGWDKGEPGPGEDGER